MTILRNLGPLAKAIQEVNWWSPQSEGHSPQTITTEVVKMLYPRDMEHLRYNIWNDHNACTSNASNKKRYQIDGQVTEMSHSNSQPLLWMIMGRSVSEKSNKMIQRFEWTPRQEKFSKKSFRASSSRDRTEEGVRLEDKDAPEWRGFLDRVNLRFGAITH